MNEIELPVDSVERTRSLNDYLSSEKRSLEINIMARRQNSKSVSNPN